MKKNQNIVSLAWLVLVLSSGWISGFSQTAPKPRLGFTQIITTSGGASLTVDDYIGWRINSPEFHGSAQYLASALPWLYAGASVNAQWDDGFSQTYGLGPLLRGYPWAAQKTGLFPYVEGGLTFQRQRFDFFNTKDIVFWDPVFTISPGVTWKVNPKVGIEAKANFSSKPRTLIYQPDPNQPGQGSFVVGDGYSLFTVSAGISFWLHTPSKKAQP